MKAKSITKRWLLNSLSIIAAALLLVAIAFFFAMKNFYYSSVKQYITNRAYYTTNNLIKYSEEDMVNFNEQVRNIVENSDIKETVEVTALNHYGETVLSSSGFQYKTSKITPDFVDAITASDGIGYFVGKSAGNEKIMAMTVTVPYLNSDYSAIRYVVSLENVDKQLVLFLAIFIGAALIILVLIFISGMYFIKSIVIPVRDVGAVAKKFASGDMRTRLIKKNNDELGELCDAINEMADELTASENMKNEFISSVSHELRTPLTAIKGWSETLTTIENIDEEKPMFQKGMKVIQSETERLSGMVEELLDFSRIQNGQMKLVKEPMDVLAELGEAVLIYSQKALQEEKEIIYEEPDAIPIIYGDKNKIKQVFINIIDNAIKYTDKGDKIYVEVEIEKNIVYIAVKDTGCGISKVDLPKVKTKFYKANMTRRGSGIGLAVATEIIKLHNGNLEIDSELNIGTTVTITVPEMTDDEKNNQLLPVENIIENKEVEDEKTK